jgi:predicted enzyme related to lactoylglutathione lyase
MNKVQHFELPADDISRAQKFYNQVFNWKSEDFSLRHDMVYHLFDSGVKKDENRQTIEPGVIDGAVIERKNEKGAVIYITVDSIDDTIKKAESAGGKKIGEKMSFEIGSYARLSDSEGNIIGLFEEAK